MGLSEVEIELITGVGIALLVFLIVVIVYLYRPLPEDGRRETQAEQVREAEQMVRTSLSRNEPYAAQQPASATEHKRDLIQSHVSGLHATHGAAAASSVRAPARFESSTLLCSGSGIDSHFKGPNPSNGAVPLIRPPSGLMEVGEDSPTAYAGRAAPPPTPDDAVDGSVPPSGGYRINSPHGSLGSGSTVRPETPSNFDDCGWDSCSEVPPVGVEEAYMAAAPPSQGQARAKKNLEKATAERKEHIKVETTCQADNRIVNRQLEVDIPIENARLEENEIQHRFKRLMKATPRPKRYEL